MLIQSSISVILLGMIPFAGLLASLALFPLFASRFWHAHFGKIAAGWSGVAIISLIQTTGPEATFHAILETFFHEYLSFIILIGSLYIVSGGILLDVRGRVSAKTNTFILGLGTVLAGWMGTTGAAMLMIRPLIRMNQGRAHQTHLMIFLIFLVANIGGALTPLGDPPLFLGFLQGVHFFWPLEYLALETLLISSVLLGLFYMYDHRLLQQESLENETPKLTFQIQGWSNFGCLLGIISLVLMSGVWQPETSFSIQSVTIKLQDAVRDLGMVAIAIYSYLKTPASIHTKNQFSWAPLSEVAKLFGGIFVTVIPVLLMLGTVPKELFSPREYFWLSGWLSAFLDNAPTYLVFFHMAGGDPGWLMTEGHLVLEAISLGAVFMGAMTYIGNAPNFMIKAMAEENGIPMPTFLGYMKWSCGILLPLLLLLTFFHFC